MLIKSKYIRIFLFFFLILIINNCNFVSYSHQIIPNHNNKVDCDIVNTLGVDKLYDSKYILYMVIDGDEKDFLVLIHYPESNKLIPVDGSGDSYEFSVQNNQLEIISTHTFGFNNIKYVFLLNLNQNTGIMKIRNIEWNIDYEESAIPFTYSVEKCD